MSAATLLLPVLLPVLSGGAAHAREPRPLKSEWEAGGLSAPAVVLMTTPVPLVAALEAHEGAVGIVAFDGRTGDVVWRASPPAGVVWASLTLGEEGLGVGGTTEAPGFSLLDPLRGTVRWSIAATADERLEVGVDGGVVVRAPCGITVIDPRTGARGEGVDGRADAGGCVAPRLLGAVEGQAVILAPAERGAGWRLFRTDGARHDWYADLPDVTGAPGVDWSTSTVWGATADGLRVVRRNLGSGALAWESAFHEPGCAGSAAPAEGPLGVPSLLVDLCSRLVLLDPHDGGEVWSAAAPEGDPLLRKGALHGGVVVPEGADVLPFGDGILVRAPAAVSLVGEGGAVTWTLVGETTAWWLVQDLLVIVPAAGAPLVVFAATGEAVGTLPAGDSPVALAPLPGTNSRRLLLTVGHGVHAWQVPGR